MSTTHEGEPAGTDLGVGQNRAVVGQNRAVHISAVDRDLAVLLPAFKVHSLSLFVCKFSSGIK